MVVVSNVRIKEISSTVHNSGRSDKAEKKFRSSDNIVVPTYKWGVVIPTHGLWSRYLDSGLAESA